MTTQLYHHPVFARHDTGPGHPERPERIEAVNKALAAAEFAQLEKVEAPLAQLEHIALVHPPAFIKRIEQAMPAKGLASLDGDTVVSTDSWQAASRAVGAVCAAVDAVISGSATRAFCAVRPPGHHAEPNQAMGFCIFNSIAIGAVHAQENHGLKRVAVIDFDVHHGNGTQAAFWDRPGCMYLSSHQSPLYPGTGASSEQGATNNIVNAPLPPHGGSEQLRAAWNDQLAPALREFQPELLLVSAGFDADGRDPLAQLDFTTADYSWISRQIVIIANECCAGKVVSALEGGYDLEALSAGVSAHVHELMRSD